MCKKIMIYVATHKPTDKVWEDDGLKFIHVGSKISNQVIDDCVRDDSGDNISELNQFYCELTGHYWIWKNDKKHSYIGLCHYRRFLGRYEYALNSQKNILSSNELERILKYNDIILPLPKRKNEKNSLYDTVGQLEMDPSFKTLKKAICQIYPDYLTELYAVFMDKRMSFGNIFVTKKETFNNYSEWLFKVLSQVEKDYSDDNRQIEPRKMGFLSEWLLNVWVRHHNLKIQYLHVHATEAKKNGKYMIKILLERFGYTV